MEGIDDLQLLQVSPDIRVLAFGSNDTNFSWIYQLPQHSTAEKIVTFLNNTYIPIVILLGMFGNVLSFIAFFFTHLKFRSSSCYLGCLAISDFGYLAILICVWLDGKGIQVMTRNGLCQGVAYLSTVFSSWSTWLTVCFTAERFIAIRFPFRRLPLCGIRKAKLICASVAIFSLGINIHCVFLSGIVEAIPGFFVCDVFPQFWRTMHYINIVDTLLTLVIPVILIIYMNFTIARTIFQFYSRHRNANHSTATRPSTSSRQQLVQGPPVTSRKETGITIAAQMNVSRTLLIVSSMFVLLNLPSYGTRLYLLVLELHQRRVDRFMLTVHRFFMLLYYTNFAINFLLYSAGNRIFKKVLSEYMRKKAKSVRCCMKKRRASFQSGSSNFV